MCKAYTIAEPSVQLEGCKALRFDLHVFDRQPQSWADGPGAGTFQHTENGNGNQKSITSRAKGGSKGSTHTNKGGNRCSCRQKHVVQG